MNQFVVNTSFLYSKLEKVFLPLMFVALLFNYGFRRGFMIVSGYFLKNTDRFLESDVLCMGLGLCGK